MEQPTDSIEILLFRQHDSDESDEATKTYKDLAAVVQDEQSDNDAIIENFILNFNEKSDHISQSLTHESKIFSPSDACVATEEEPCYTDEDVGMLKHNFTKLLVEQSNIDQTMYYLIQEDEVEVLKSFGDAAGDDCSDAEFYLDLSHLDPSSHHLQLHPHSGAEVHERTDDHGNLDPHCIHPRDPSCNQSLFSNVSSIHTTESLHTICCTFHEAGRRCYTNMGHELINILKSMNVKERRPLMAITVEHAFKNDMELLMGERISKYEWSMARKHRKYPGPGRSIKNVQKYFRKRVKEAVVSEFIEWLNASDMLQNLSYGHKIVKYCNGYHVPIEAVKKNKSTSAIIREYIEFWNEGRSASLEPEKLSDNDISDDDSIGNVTDNDQCCSSVCKKTGAPCLKESGHEGRHSFTPKGMLSPSIIEQILNQLTSGQIKSLIGLDNTSVESGHENFLGMKAWVQKLSDVGKVAGQTFSDTDILMQKITNVAEFHKVGYARHLGQDESIHICTCFQCGFYSQDDSIACKLHDDAKHLGPCKECMESFKLFEDMFSFHQKVNCILEEGGFYDHNPVLKDDMDAWHDEIHEHIRHILKFRAHVAQREDEAKFDKEFYSKMSNGEALVIFDYKMKILASMFREKQVDWFSKRGFSCLGCLILFGSSDNSETHDVEYHFFLSDDTTQDTQAVNIAKEILYKCILSNYRVHKVHFRCDGAGCFAAAEAKGMIAKWHGLTGIREASYKTMVPGCGKTSLDGMFGILGQHLSRLVDQGESFNSAEELWGLLDRFPLKYSFFHLFKPQRTKAFYFDPNDAGIKNLKLRSSFYLIKCDDDGKVWGFCHSRHGRGVRLDMLEVPHKDSLCNTEFGVIQSKRSNSPHGGPSERSTVTICKENDIVVTSDPLIHIVKSRLLSADNTPTTMIKHIRSQYITNARQHKLQKAKKRMHLVNDELIHSRENLLRKLEEQGIFMCHAVDNETKAGCLKQYISLSLRQRHENRCLSQDERHLFPQETLVSGVLKDVRNGKWAFCLACGAMTNRDSEVAEKYVIKICDEYPSFKHLDLNMYFSQGSYRRGNKQFKKKPFRASADLLADLEILFLEGESREDTMGSKSKASKYSPEQAISVLANLMDGNRRKYRQGGSHGPLPTHSFVKNWFSRRKTKGAIDLEHIKSDKFDKMNKNELKEECLKTYGRDVLQTKGMLIKLLETDDYIRDGGTDGCYSNAKIQLLKKECQSRNLPTTATIGAMKLILRIDEKNRTAYDSLLEDTITMTLALEALEENKLS